MRNLIKTKHLLCAPLLGACAILGGPGAVNAADVGVAMPTKAVAAPTPLASPWSIQVMPYFWAPSLNGFSTVRGRTTDIDVTFYDLVRNAEVPKDLWGVMGYLEMRNGHLSLFSDLVYMKLSVAASGARSVSVAPEVGGTLAASLGVTVKMAIAEVAAAYQIAQWNQGFPFLPGSTAVDLYAGARVWWQKVEADLAVSAGLTVFDLALAGSRAVAASGDISWVDPMVGLRLRQQIAPGKEIVVKGDVGGFGAGSDFSWQVLGAYTWDFAVYPTITWSGMLGYRALFVDYTQGSGRTLYQYNMLQHGPIVGISMRF